MSMNGSQPFVTIKFEFFYAFYLRPSLASFLLPIFFFFCSFQIRNWLKNHANETINCSITARVSKCLDNFDYAGTRTHTFNNFCYSIRCCSTSTQEKNKWTELREWRRSISVIVVLLFWNQCVSSGLFLSILGTFC